MFDAHSRLTGGKSILTSLLRWPSATRCKIWRSDHHKMPSEAEMPVVDTCRSRGHFSWSTPSYRRGGVGVLSSRDLCEEGDTSSSGASFGRLTKVESPGGGQGGGGGCPAACATDGGTSGCTSNGDTEDAPSSLRGAAGCSWHPVCSRRFCSALAKPFPVAGPLATPAAGVVEGDAPDQGDQAHDP